MKKQKKPNINSIYFLRIFAMLMVILVHVTGAYTYTLLAGTGAYEKYHFINRIIRIEAGIFIVITGMVFFYNYINRPLTISLWKNYYIKRVSYILVPYLVWAIIYEIYSHWGSMDTFNLQEALVRIARGESYYQLHFIFLIVQVYLVLPIFVYIAQKWMFFRKYMWLFGIAIEVCYSLLNSAYHFTTLNLFVDSLATFLLGAWIGVYYQELREKAFKKSNILLLIFTFAIGTITVILHYHIYTMQTLHLPAAIYNMCNLTFMVVGSYTAFLVAEMLAQKFSPKYMAIVKNIAVYSFGFYLIHPLVLTGVAKFIPLQANVTFHFSMLATYIAVVFLCYTIIWAVHKFLPFANFMFGKLPKKAVFLYEHKSSTLKG
ncbi:acyltransferase [Priestia filamentosa]|uniref:acyltransferase n=1 Tax=Priestia filamentosa TaxID=1402861 RepID=UPI001FB45522|nr:acyltransferase [Priestia filamentosa]MED3726408.1 acyltransferase [Priestia filamentosa]UOE60392.1 acyltransferase [Priestia filamentosa]